MGWCLELCWGYEDHMALLVSLFLLNLILTVYELAQFTMLLLDYFTDVWNLVDFLRLLTMSIYIVQMWVGLGDRDSMHVLSV